jgi:hypothetical protein
MSAHQTRLHPLVLRLCSRRAFRSEKVVAPLDGRSSRGALFLFFFIGFGVGVGVGVGFIFGCRFFAKDPTSRRVEIDSPVAGSLRFQRLVSSRDRRRWGSCARLGGGWRGRIGGDNDSWRSFLRPHLRTEFPQALCHLLTDLGRRLLRGRLHGQNLRAVGQPQARLDRIRGGRASIPLFPLPQFPGALFERIHVQEAVAKIQAGVGHSALPLPQQRLQMGEDGPRSRPTASPNSIAPVSPSRPHKRSSLPAHGPGSRSCRHLSPPATPMELEIRDRPAHPCEQLVRHPDREHPHLWPVFRLKNRAARMIDALAKGG